MPADHSTQLQVPGGITRTSEVPGRKLYHDVVVIPAAGGRVRFKRSNGLKAFTVQALDTNARRIYLGDKDVTDQAGAKPGFSLAAGGALENIQLENAAELYVAGAAGAATITAVLIGIA